MSSIGDLGAVGPAGEPEPPPFVDELDVAQTLARAERATLARRALEVEQLVLAQHFARLHSDDPAEGVPPGQRPPGSNRLVQLGGAGTPKVQDLPICELAIALRVTEPTARRMVADGLDLDHRLRKTWLALREGEGEVWVARRVATLARGLAADAVAEVDAAVAAVIGTQSPGRVLQTAEEAVLAADTETARAERAAQRRERCVKLGRTDEFGLRTIFARVAAGDAVWVDALVERVAERLEGRPDLTPELPRDEDGTLAVPHEELRAVALGWLAHPDDVIALLSGDLPEAEAEAEDTPAVRRRRSRAVVYVHLHEAATTARVEDVGPLLRDELRELPSHARVELKPVIDLHLGRAIDRYQHPEDVVERTMLRTGGDVFPHSGARSRRVDHDHPAACDEHGPPGQTGDHNDAPLLRRVHRAKTHLGYEVDQIGPGEYVWTTPHGLRRLVDPDGTHVIDELAAWTLTRGRRVS